MTLTQEYLKEVINYCPNTGIFRWAKSRRGVSAGTECGYVDNHGYRRIGLLRSDYAAHRLAWIYMNGVAPEFDIDHKDGNRSNNAYSNLREATRAENLQNMRKKRHSSGKPSASRYVGVTFHVGKNRWQARITKDGVSKHLGWFIDEESAHHAYLDAKKLSHLFQPIPREFIFNSAHEVHSQ